MPLDFSALFFLFFSSLSQSPPFPIMHLTYYLVSLPDGALKNFEFVILGRTECMLCPHTHLLKACSLEDI